MASITKRGRRWLVQVRRKGEAPQSRTFSTQADARAWAVSEEARIERAEPPTPRRLLAATTLGQVVSRYMLEVTPAKRSAATEAQRLKQFQRDKLASVDLAALSSDHVADYRDRRLGAVEAGTVRRELAILSHVLEIARKEWGYRLAGNPVKDIRQPALSNARDRRLQPGEFDRLLAATDGSRNRHLKPIVRLAVETGMRRGELLDLKWSHIDLARRVVHIPITKTGKPRTIPLTDGAIEVLGGREQVGDVVFPITSNAFKLAWGRAVLRSGLDDLHFHDLRHEAVSRFFEIGLSLPEVAVISGHRDPRMLFRYTHLRPHELAQKLAGRRWQDLSQTCQHASASSEARAA